MAKKPQTNAGKPEDKRGATDGETIRDLTTPEEEAKGVRGGATSGDDFPDPSEPVPM